MSIEIGSKWVKDVEVVEVLNCRKNHGGIYQDMIPCVWFIFDGDTHVLTERDFLEQYKPYEPVYEYRYALQLSKERAIVTDDFYKDDEEFVQAWLSENDKSAYQRLDFTKRERKC